MTPDKKDETHDDYNDTVLASGFWIDKDFINDVMTTAFGEVNVQDVHITAVVGAGDEYYHGILYRVVINYTTKDSGEAKTKNLIVKGLPLNSILMRIVEALGIFRKEALMYTELLPAMQKVFKEYFPEDVNYVVPASYICHRDNTLVMEDLKVEGYQMTDRQKQLDYDHCAVTLKSLALFHALSVKVHELQPEMVEKMHDLYSAENRELVGPITEQCFNLISHEISSWGQYAKYGDDLHEIGDCIYDKLVEMVKPTENLNVVAHGDFWIKNVMYKYDDNGRVVACKLVDFQFSRYSTPAMDLLYFFFTSVRPDLLSNNMYALVDIYHEALIANLATLGIKEDYPIERLHQDMRDRAAYAFVALVRYLPIAICKPGGFDFEKAGDEKPLFQSNYRYPYYVDVCGRILDHMNRIEYVQDAKDRWKHLTKEKTGI